MRFFLSELARLQSLGAVDTASRCAREVITRGGDRSIFSTLYTQRTVVNHAVVAVDMLGNSKAVAVVGCRASLVPLVLKVVHVLMAHKRIEVRSKVGIHFAVRKVFDICGETNSLFVVHECTDNGQGFFRFRKVVHRFGSVNGETVYAFFKRLTSYTRNRYGEILAVCKLFACEESDVRLLPFRRIEEYVVKALPYFHIARRICPKG